LIKNASRAFYINTGGGRGGGLASFCFVGSFQGGCGGCENLLTNKNGKNQLAKRNVKYEERRKWWKIIYHREVGRRVLKEDSRKGRPRDADIFPIRRGTDLPVFCGEGID